jgi:hypothetical protein
MIDIEKLGAFYLGRLVDPNTGARTDDPLLYDSRDLTTHAVIVGMTGSGKTGLGIALLEEAAIDGVPAIAIDPKGDLGNLLLTFPALRPSDFRPYVDPGAAARAGLDADAFAAQTAGSWKTGLADWGQDPARIGRYADAVERAIYTPGSTAGRPLSVLRSLAAPPPELRADDEARRDRVAATASGLLALLGIDSDPLRGREAILLGTLFDQAWRDGRDLALGDLVRLVQTPPFDRVGVLDLETFYPAKDRAALAIALNGLIASPGFAAWIEGEPLDAKRLLYTDSGRPRLSVISIAHLSDAERMFLVTLLLHEVLAWARSQPGTTSLRAILYMDEIAGYAPPTAAPPSKGPLLTLMKQARAFGVGVVLATQNPVDLDYKGLSNAGTWFLGRLQTERDKMRVLDGLEGAAATGGATLDRGRADTLLSGLKSRRFLLASAHADAPVLFESRWALSYLAGPLTRPQIQALTAASPAPASADPTTSPAPAARPAGPGSPTAASPPASIAGSGRPALPAEVPEFFLAAPAGATLSPALLATARLHYVDAKSGIDQWTSVTLIAPLAGEPAANPWEAAESSATEPALERDPPSGARFAPLPALAARAATYTSWKKALASALFQARPLPLFACAPLKLTSKPGESEGDFRVRVRDAARARRDEALDALRAKYAPKLQTLEERARQAAGRVEREEGQFQQQSMQTAISVGATVLGALFGRRSMSTGTVGRATTAMRGASRAAREHADIADARAAAASVGERRQALEQEMAAEVTRLQTDPEPAIDSLPIAPRKADIGIDRVALVWRPQA